MAFLKRPQLIPEGWEEHHRPILDGSYTAIAELREPGGGYDYDTGEYLPGALIAQGVPCRIQRQGPGRGGSGVSQLVDTREVQVTAPVDDIPELDITDDGPILTVTGYKPGHKGDPHLINKPLRVTNVYPGSLLWERVLTATTEV